MSEYWSDGKTEDTVDVNEETIFNLFEDIRCLKEPSVPVRELEALRRRNKRAIGPYNYIKGEDLDALIAKAKGGCTGQVSKRSIKMVQEAKGGECE